MAAARALPALPLGMAPHDVQAEPDQHDATQQPDQIARRPADAEQRQHVQGDPDESEPAHEDGRPDEPESGARRRHGDDPEALGAGREQEAAEHEDQPDDQEDHEIGEHDLLEQRRPLEQQEGADAADGEGEQDAKTVESPPPDRAQAFALGLKAAREEARANSGPGPPVQPLEAEA